MPSIFVTTPNSYGYAVGSTANVSDLVASIGLGANWCVLSQTRMSSPLSAADQERLGAVVATSPSRATLRNVATGCQVPNTKNTSGPKQTNSRRSHTARDIIASPQLVYGNWAPFFSTGEIGIGAPSTVTASIEYPAGVFTPARWGGNSSVVIPDLGEAISDPLAIVIPNGAQFWTHQWIANSVGIFYCGVPASIALGEAFEFGATVTDKTLGGVLVDSGAGMTMPFAIIAMSSRPSVFMTGDSRCQGQNDTPVGALTNDVGELGRPIGASYAYINAGTPTEGATLAKVNSTKRSSLARRFCTHVLSNYGVNDINFYTHTGAVALADLVTLWAQYSPLPVFQTTIPPVSTSTDAWVTTGNQTTAPTNAQRVILNNSLRQSVAVSAVIEVADFVETSRDSGLWKAPGYTTDGLHESQLANAVIASQSKLFGIALA